MNSIEKAYTFAVKMGIEKNNRQDNINCSREHNNEEFMYNSDLMEMADEIRKEFTETQAYRFMSAFKLFDNSK